MSMKIAITVSNPSLDAPVDPRFGRCPHFAFVDGDTMRAEFVENPAWVSGSGAGIQAAQLVVDEGAEAVLTGNCGPKAHQVLSAADVAVVVGCSGSAREAVASFKAGELKSAAAPNVSSHFGMGGPGFGSAGQGH
jgi:predicted Fe-Mo cluster-binding NifX family protein